MKNITAILDKSQLSKDENGIWVVKRLTKTNSNISQQKWEEIYDFGLKKLLADRKIFNTNKLQDHMNYVESTFPFNKNTIYLEIGCGPSYVGEYLMKLYGVKFIGIDFNYKILKTLKKYLESRNYSDFILIYADISDMPLKRESVDYIYGGGVIEHFHDTKKILSELKRVLKPNGVIFNTVPAFNLSWGMRIFSTIPSVPILRQISEYFHITLLSNKLLNKHHGYELNFTSRTLESLHRKLNFRDIKIGAFAFHPSEHVIRSKFIREIFYKIAMIKLTTPIYYVTARKK